MHVRSLQSGNPVLRPFACFNKDHLTRKTLAMSGNPSAVHYTRLCSDTLGTKRDYDRRAPMHFIHMVV